VNLKVLYCKNNRFNKDYIKYLKNYCRDKKIALWIDKEEL
jgi:hypothetical protein